MRKLIFLLLTPILKASSLKKYEDNYDKLDVENLLKDPEKIVAIESIDCGEKALKLINNFDKKTDDSKITKKVSFLYRAKKFYKESAIYIIEHSRNMNLHCFECISPLNIKDSKSLDYIKKIATLLPLNDVDIDQLANEWRLIQIDRDINFSSSSKERESIDIFWGRIFSLYTLTEPRYPNAIKVVKAILSLTHGSADVERGFSESGNLLTQERSNMSELTLNSVLAVLDGLKRYNNKVHEVPITTDLMKLARNAHKSYQDYLKNELQKKEEEERKKQADEALLAKEKAIAENLQAEALTIKKLEIDYKNKNKEYNLAVKEADEMQNVLDNSTGVTYNLPTLKRLLKGLKECREEEKKKLKECQSIQAEISIKKTQAMNKSLEQLKKKSK